MRSVKAGCSRDLLVRSSRQTELPFSRAEFKQRLRKAQAEMRARGLDLLVLSAPESMFYICGYRAEWYQAQSPEGWPPASCVAVRSDSDDFILLDVDDEELMVRSETTAPEIRIYHDSPTPMTAWVVSELKAEGLFPCTIGLEMGSYRPNRLVSEVFERMLKMEGCVVVDGTGVVRKLRALKSEAEMECVRRASKIADIGMNAGIESMSAGVTELQIYGEMIRAMARAGGENPAITIPVISGRRSARMHSLASTKPIRKGDIVNIDLCGVFRRYHSNMARTYSVGRPDPAVQRVVEASAKSFDILRDSLRPHMSARELIRLMASYYSGAGIKKDLLWFGGYDIGIGFPPDWVGVYSYDEHSSPPGLAFVPGTTVNYESNFFLPKMAGASMLINTIAFERNRARILSAIPSDLIIV